jgi:predicted DNA-binding transcriptional regulator YafY
MITTEVEQVRMPILVRALVEQRAMQWVRYALGTRLRIGMAIEDGRVEVEIRSPNEHSVAAELAGFGRMVEVLGPVGVRERLEILAAELAGLYSGTAASANSAIDVKRHVGDTSPDGVAVAPDPPLA